MWFDLPPISRTFPNFPPLSPTFPHFPKLSSTFPTFPPDNTLHSITSCQPRRPTCSWGLHFGRHQKSLVGKTSTQLVQTRQKCGCNFTKKTITKRTEKKFYLIYFDVIACRPSLVDRCRTIDRDFQVLQNCCISGICIDSIST